MKRRGVRCFLTRLGALLFIMAGALYLLSGPILRGSTYKVLNSLKAHSSELGFKVRDVSYEGVYIRGPVAVTWTGMRIEFEPELGENAGKVIRFRFQEVTIGIIDILRGIAEFRGSDLRVKLPSTRAGPVTLKLDDLNFQFLLDGANQVQNSAKMMEYVQDVLKFLSSGVSHLSLQCRGSLLFEYQGKSRWVDVHSVKRRQNTLLLMNESDLWEISAGMADALARAEVSLLADYAMRVPKLLEIRDTAKYFSEVKYQQDRRTPRDTFRFVLWGFLLTREFGTEFAKEVIEAFQAGNRGEAQRGRLVALHNAKIGREYAVGSKKESELLRLIANDTRIIRS